MTQRPNPDAVFNCTTLQGDHAHARHERDQLVLIVTGGADGSIPHKTGGIRLPRDEALALARFIIGEPTDGN